MAAHSPEAVRRLKPFIIGSVLVLGASSVAIRGLNGSIRFLVVLGSAWLVNGAARGIQNPIGAWLEAPVMVHLGRLSYGLYIWHNLAIPAVLYSQRHLDVWLRVAFTAGWGQVPLRHGWAQFAFVSIVTYAMALTSWHLFERRLNALKVRFPYVPRRSAASESTPIAARAISGG